MRAMTSPPDARGLNVGIRNGRNKPTPYDASIHVDYIWRGMILRRSFFAPAKLCLTAAYVLALQWAQRDARDLRNRTLSIDVILPASQGKWSWRPSDEVHRIGS